MERFVNDKAEKNEKLSLEISLLQETDTNSFFHHRGEVNLETGNIRFLGNVKIDGNIHPSMFVGALGTIRVGGTVTKATIHAVRSTYIEGNVFSSTINIGQQSILMGELCTLLTYIVNLLEKPKEIILQMYLNTDAESISDSRVRVLVAESYPTLIERIKIFIQKVKNRTELLSAEWIILADKLYIHFVRPLSDPIRNAKEYEQLLLDAEEIIKKYSANSCSKTELVLPYAVNSVLCSSGDIHVTSKGLFHCMVTAQQDITVEGVCRGGEIIANRKISLQAAGSDNGVKTVIQTTAEGSITLGLVHSGTEIQIGTKTHTFMEKRLGVFARLDEQGELEF